MKNKKEFQLYKAMEKITEYAKEKYSDAFPVDIDKKKFGEWFAKWNSKRTKRLLKKLNLDTKDIILIRNEKI